MSTAFKVINNNKEEKSRYPSLPFVTQDKYGYSLLVFYDNALDKYRYIILTDEENIGKTSSIDYDSLEEMFNDNKDDIILDVELVIKGSYKS